MRRHGHSVCGFIKRGLGFLWPSRHWLWESPPGLTTLSLFPPVDINECLSISAPCPVGQTCINTEGSYTCQKNVPNCGRGYHLNEEGTRCVGWY